jgi:calcineurin-like phosphoesterase
MNTPRKLEVAKRDIRLTGALVDIDETTGRATSVKRIQERVED